MKYTLLITAVIALAQAAPLVNNGGKAIPDSYIVVLKDGNSLDSFQPKFDDIARRQNGRGRKATIHRKYDSFAGFAATVNDATLKELLASDEVEYIEQDSIVTVAGQQSNPPSWGLPRISQHDRDLTAPYFYNNAAGQGVTAYVIDSGVYIGHNDFGGRASWGVNFVTGSPDTDQHGHGTHVAAILGGTQYGVAKMVNIVAVKVLDGTGAGSASNVIAGMDWVAQHAVPGKTVVNMSLGGGKSQAIDAAAQRLYLAHAPLFAAAGNRNSDACNSSPAGANNVYTVVSSDSKDNVGSFSSWGPCVEIYAPGAGIRSAWIGSPDAAQTLTGSSMASPFVAGTAALYQSFLNLPTAQAVFNHITNTATLNKLTGNLNGNPNRLVYNGGQ